MRISDWSSDVCSSDLLLIRAASWVKPGGVLVYATCSLERAEGEEQIEPLISERGTFDMDNIDPVVLPADVAPAEQGWLRTLPSLLADKGRLDGFFVARSEEHTSELQSLMRISYSVFCLKTKK